MNYKEEALKMLEPLRLVGYDASKISGNIKSVHDAFSLEDWNEDVVPPLKTNYTIAIVDDKSDEEVLTMLDLSLSVRDNHAMLQDAGVRIGTKRINRLLKSARDQQAQQPPITPEQPLSVSDLGSTTTDTTANGWSGLSWSNYTSPFGF